MDGEKENPPAENPDGEDMEGEQPEEVEEEVIEFNMADDEFYPEDHVEKHLPDSDLSRRSIEFYGCYGQSSFKRYNFHYLGDDTFIFAAGNTYHIINILTGEKRIFHANDTDGVGSICVHPSKKYFAVAMKGPNPNIFIYEYPSLKLYRICRKGTEKLYAHVEFSNTGEKLASLGGAPDYTLTIWDWVKQRVILKAKAFSQEIFRVSFSPYTDDILFTSGQGHIRFWKMAQTFTGLKLQGEIAKFGQLELSDVSSFYELPDGKVISGTEYGTLVVWEGQFVKSHLMLDDVTKKPLHDGMIEVILQEEENFITAGTDGWIKWWRVSEVDAAEADEGVDFPIRPVKEIQISENKLGKNPAHIMNMISAGKKWFIQDGKGRIYSLSKDSDEYNQIYSFHQGSINDLITSPSHNYACTIGQNGMIKVWDYAKKVVFTEKIFSGVGTCLEHIPHTDQNKGRIFAAGFDNGIVRVFRINTDGLDILKTFKAHEDGIMGIKFSKDLKMCVTGSKTGDVFFFMMDPVRNVQQFEPLCTIKLPDDSCINDFRWKDDDQHVIFGCKNGKVFKVRRPEASEIDNSDSYLWENPDIQDWTIQISDFQMQKNQKKDEAEEEKKRRMRLRGELPPEDEEEEEVWEPQPIRTVMPLSFEEGKDQFLVSSSGKFNGFIYFGEFGVQRPVKAIPINPDVHVTYMNMVKSKEGDMLIIGYDDGNVEFVLNQNFERRMSIKYHDGHHGAITGVQFNKDENFLITTGLDGLVFVHKFDKKCAMNEVNKDFLQGVEGANFMAKDEKERTRQKKMLEYYQENPPIFPDHEDYYLDEAALAITIQNKEPSGIDIDDPTIYSIQKSKLRTEEDHRLSLAEKKKEQVRAQIQELRDWFKKVHDKNETSESHLKADDEDFQIDPDFFAELFDRNEAKIEETKKEVAWGIEYHTVNLNKLKSKFYDVLEFEKFTVKSIKGDSYVTTFRVQKMSEFLQQNIESFKQMLESEITGKDNNDDDEFNDEDEKEENQQDNAKKKEKEKAAALAAKQKAAQEAALNAKKSEGEKKREQRKLEREERKRKIEKLEKKEAMHSGEDPEERKAIEEAKATFGDYKLKMSHDYTVPENQRVNFSKKRQQMVLLEGSIHKLKVDFNQKIQELKLRKKDIVDHVAKLNERLGEINKELGIQEELFQPTIDKEAEYPENFFEINDKDIIKFKKQKEINRLKAAGKAYDHIKLNEEDEEEDGKKEDTKDAKKQQVPPRKNAKQNNQQLQDEFNEIRRIELMYEKDQKKKEIEELTEQFDSEIKEMQKEKYRLESDLKNAEMKLILFFEELILLKSMEGKDITLTKRLAACRQEKGQILKEINEISRKLKEKKKEIDEIKEREEELMAKFHEACPERSDKYEEIRKFFEKIIRRRRRVEKPEKGENEEDEDEEDVEEEEEMEEDDDEDEDENTVAGLPPEEYKIEEIEKLREERLDLYEDKEKILQFINDLEVQRKRLENKEKAIKTDLEETEEEIQDFQSEKLSKLNQLQVSVVLKVKQIQNLKYNQSAVEKWQQIREEEIAHRMEQIQNRENGENNEDPMFLEQQKEAMLNEEDWRGYKLAPDLRNSILFTRTQLLQLINRKRVLDEEYVNLNKSFKDAKREFNQKKREIKENEKTRELRERDYNERQMLRFGNLVDLDNLEVSGPSAVVMELQNKFEKTEKRCIKMIEDAEAEFDQTQRQLTSEMKNNTNLLNLIRQLCEEELDLDKKLNDSNKAIFVDEDDAKKKHIMEEKLKIKKLLEIQAKEIETFKTEINMYKRKGGHIYTKVTTNRRVANLNNDN